MKTILSLFDHSYNWVAPYSASGMDCLPMDEKNTWWPVDIKDLCVEWFIDQGIEWVDGLLAAPPCTDFTVSGNRYWEHKDNSGVTEQSVELARQVLRCVDFWKPDFWAVENPVGRFGRLLGLGEARLIFDPCDYAGYTTGSKEQVELDRIRAKNGEGVTKEEIALVKRCGAYTKKTCLWGEFNLPRKWRIEPVKCNRHGSWLLGHGGKSERTKAARSETPLGFATAFYMTNHWTPEREAALLDWREREDPEAPNPFVDGNINQPELAL